jgi:hypothetical protein
MLELCRQNSVQKTTSRVPQLAGVFQFAFKTSRSLVLESGLEDRGWCIAPSVHATRYVNKISYRNRAN